MSRRKREWVGLLKTICLISMAKVPRAPREEVLAKTLGKRALFRCSQAKAQMDGEIICQTTKVVPLKAKSIRKPRSLESRTRPRAHPQRRAKVWLMKRARERKTRRNETWARLHLTASSRFRISRLGQDKSLRKRSLTCQRLRSEKSSSTTTRSSKSSQLSSPTLKFLSTRPSRPARWARKSSAKLKLRYQSFSSSDRLYIG